MMIDQVGRCGLVRAGLFAILAGLLGACAEQSSPAPVIMGGATEPTVYPMPAPSPPSARHIIVRRGQSLGGVANLYHVPKSAIIAANGLQPPYELKIGARLTIPAAGAPAPWTSAPNAREPSVAAATPLPPPHPETLAPPQQQAAIPQPPPSPASVRGQPAVIPLDGPPPKEAAAAPARPAPTAPLTPPQVAAGPSPSANAGTPGNADGSVPGRFPWPVRGRILAGYGSAAGGGHNDGINIAAPLGTPVRAIEAGTVAYAGNEVKGYGNIILIRHADGWISAYAHLDNVTVKPGETIAAGEVIAKVGETGGVAEPQLHFELRRGKKPVNPKEFLAPAPSAEGFVGNRAVG